MDGSLQAAAGSEPVQEEAPAQRRWVRPVMAGAVLTAVAAVALGVWAGVGGSGPETAGAGRTAPAVREPLVVSITESGEVDAKRSTVIRCEVEGQSTIVWIIEEGTVVKEGDELVRLDSADLEENLRTQEMAYKTAKAAYEKADKAHLIAQSNRESLLAEARLAVKFALLDLRKYLGSDLADSVVAGEGTVDFDRLIQDERLGGEGLQQKRKLSSDIALAEEELKRATSKAEWTRRLEGLGYVTGSELEADELAARRRQVELQQAKTALDLFATYEFPKQAEQYYTDWLESKRELERVDTRTRSDVDSAQTELANKGEALRLEKTRLDKVREQLAATTIRAPQPGMVVYYSERRRRGSSEPLETGATVRHQQELIKLPDLSEMNVEVRLHESVVKQVELDDTAYVRVDALPEQRLTGRVTKIAVMPDRQNWWLNPGLKTYTSEVTLDETPPGLKPGMNAQVEILVDRQDDVLQVPISAVHVEKGFQVVYVQTPSGIETRRVTAGLSNQQRVAIEHGLAEGERVYLYRPSNAPALEVPEGVTPPGRAADRLALPGGGGRREEGRDKRPGGGAGARGDEAGPAEAGGPKPDLSNLTPQQMRKVRERLKDMPADQRRRLLERMQKQRPEGTDGGPDEASSAGDSPRGNGNRPDRDGRRPKGRGAAAETSEASP